jgi:cytochrome P450
MLSLDAGKGAIGQALREDPCGLLYRLAAERPGEPALLQLGSEQLLILQDAPAFHRVLRENPDNYLKNFGSFAAFFGRSRLTSDGERWRYLHKLTQPILAGSEAGRIVRTTVDAYARASERMLAENTSDGAMALDPYLDAAAASVVFDAALGLDPEQLSQEFFADLRTLLHFSGRMTWNLPGAVVPADPQAAAEADRALARVRQALLRVADNERRKTSGCSAFLQALLSADQDQVDLIGEVSSQLFAGFDTTASALGWTVWLLANQPKLQDRLRAGIATVLADGEPALEHMAQLPELLALVHEAMRMFPPVPILSRIAIDADTVCAIPVAARQKVLLSVIGLHHDSNFWKEPGRMSIDRFPEGEVTAEQREHHMAFSAGPRTCGGSRFAMVEMPIAIMTLLRRLRFDVVGQEPLRFTWSASLRRRDGMRLAVTEA